jgi:alpha-1,3-rhamnosyl/mannosyltransferase
VVASDVSSLPEVVGEGGVLLRPYDVAGMAGALLQLFLDDAFHAKLRERALRHAATFSWEATAAATHAAYREVVPSSA